MTKFAWISLFLWAFLRPFFCLPPVDAADDIFNAVYSESIKRLEKCIAKGDDVNVRDSQKYTPLMSAIIHSWTEGVGVLIKAGADINVKANKDSRHHEGEFTPLHLACLKKDNNIVRVLIEAGADINTKTDRGRTPIMVALSGGPPYPEWRNELYEYNKWYRRIFYELDTLFPPELHMQAIYLVAAEATANGVALSKNSAGKNGKVPDTPPDKRTKSVVALLMTAGADPAIRDNDGRSAFEYAADNHRFDELSYLLIRNRNQCVNLQKHLLERMKLLVILWKNPNVGKWEARERLNIIMLPVEIPLTDFDDEGFPPEIDIFEFLKFYQVSVLISASINNYFAGGMYEKQFSD